MWPGVKRRFCLPTTVATCLHASVNRHQPSRARQKHPLTYQMKCKAIRPHGECFGRYRNNVLEHDASASRLIEQGPNDAGTITNSVRRQHIPGPDISIWPDATAQAGQRFSVEYGSRLENGDCSFGDRKVQHLDPARGDARWCRSIGSNALEPGLAFTGADHRKSQSAQACTVFARFHLSVAALRLLDY